MVTLFHRYDWYFGERNACSYAWFVNSYYLNSTVQWKTKRKKMEGLLGIAPKITCRTQFGNKGFRKTNPWFKARCHCKQTWFEYSQLPISHKSVVWDHHELSVLEQTGSFNLQVWVKTWLSSPLLEFSLWCSFSVGCDLACS